jgi:DNA-binding transcriptional regulator PaaX
VVVEIPALSNDDLRDRSQIQVAAHGPGRIAVSTVFSPEAPLVRDVDRSVGYNEKTTQFFDWRLR